MSIKLLSGRLLLITLLITLQNTAGAQIEQPIRYELPVDNVESAFSVTPSESSLYLSRQLTDHRKEYLQLIKLDSSLQAEWSGFVELEKNYFLIDKKAFNGKLYLLVRYRDFTKNDLVLFIIDQTGSFIRHDIKGYIPFGISNFEVTPQAVLVSGYFNKIPLVLYFSLTNFSSSVLPGSFSDVGEITHLKTYEDGTFDVLISVTRHRKNRTILIKSYTATGQLAATTPLDGGVDKSLIFGRSLKTNNEHIVAGVYGTRSADYSNGIFVAKIDAEGNRDIQYYHFADLDNFFKYMKAKREQRVRDRIERRKVKGRQVRLQYRFLVHELLIENGQYIFMGEAFYPKYIYVNQGMYGMTGGFRGPAPSGRIFDGYHYTHAVIIGITPEGSLIWDNSFEINDVKTFNLEQFVKLDVRDEDIALLYLFDNEIRSKIINNGKVVEGKTTARLSTGGLNERIKDSGTDGNKLEYWYDGFLVAYGTQDIQSTGTDRSRKVFFINKIKPVPGAHLPSPATQ